MKLEDVRTFKTVYLPSHNHILEDRKINELLALGWRIIADRSNPNDSAYMYLGHPEFVEETE